MDIEQLRKKQDEHQISVYEEYERALRERYISLSPEERTVFLRGLEFLIAEDNQSVALLDVKKHTRKRGSKGKENTKIYISNIDDEEIRKKINYMLEKGLDKKEVKKVLTKIPRTQDEIAAQIGIRDGTLRSSLHHIRREGMLGMSETSAKICKYLIDNGYQIKDSS